MNGERREPTFSGGTKISDTPKKAATKTPPETAQKRRPPPVASASVAANKGSPLALFVGVVAIAFSGFIYWQLLQAQQALKSSEARIIELESKLTLSGDASNQSMTALQLNLRTQQKDLVMTNTEVRKLWDTRNVNRKAITANSNALKAVSEASKKVNSSVASVERLAKSQAVNLNALVTNNQLQTEQLTLIEGQADEQQKRLRELQDKAVATALSLNELSAGVKSNEEAVASIDVYRRSTNRQLLELQETLNKRVVTQ